MRERWGARGRSGTQRWPHVILVPSSVEGRHLREAVRQARLVLLVNTSSEWGTYLTSWPRSDRRTRLKATMNYDLKKLPPNMSLERDHEHQIGQSQHVNKSSERETYLAFFMKVMVA
jgi:hypothetical protein